MTQNKMRRNYCVTKHERDRSCFFDAVICIRTAMGRNK